MLVAVFGDVHGALQSVYHMVRTWETREGKRIEAVLQTGDLGVFPEISNLDRPTSRHAQDDPSELDLLSYLEGKLVATRPTYFIRGNHEDFDFLSKYENRAFDSAGLIIQVNGYMIIAPREASTEFTILGIGGIEPPSGSNLGVTLETKGKYIDRKEVCDALTIKDRVDVLLTHDGPRGYSVARVDYLGSPTILKVLEKLRPRFHFFGHWTSPPPPTKFGNTWIVPMNPIGSDVYHLPNRKGAMGILNTNTWSFDYVTIA
jgi:Icc-related predicted phosphoesterase